MMMMMGLDWKETLEYFGINKLLAIFGLLN